ncbi:MAG: DUF5060 domain-containing protein, partial [Verrucomicrobiota bacterium]
MNTRNWLRFWKIVLVLTLGVVGGSFESKGAEQQINVPLWEPHDFLFSGQSTNDNPFSIPFAAEVTGPKGSKLLLPGFYDGNSVWKIRVSPTMIGEWKLVTHSSMAQLNGRDLAFVCVANPSPIIHGGLRVDPLHPYHFVFEDGARCFPLGYECDWLWALDMTNANLPTVNRLLDKLAASGFNY